MSARVLVIDNYDSFTYNLVDYIATAGAEVRVERNDAVTAEQAEAWGPTHVVVSPGPGTPREAGVSEEVVRRLAGRIPILGVCLGHQVICELYGGRVDRAARIVHGKPDEVTHDGSALYAGLPSPFEAGRYHSLVLVREDLPEELELTAWTEDGLVMGAAHRELPRFGVQFHPESILTPEGPAIVENFLALSTATG
jgi:anthranilate synthase/aminodeoxychorismate synthase-like glutamine amidotransferase